MRIGAIAAAVIVLTWIAAGAFAGALSAPGYISSDTPVTVLGPYLGGFDVLPNGNFVINDGYSVREITSAGVDVRTLYTFESSVFASFVRYASGKVYFGESSNGLIYSLDWFSPGEAELLADLDYNFDLEIWGGRPYVVAGTATYDSSSIYLLDGGGVDVIVSQVPTWSGPLAFDSEGNLYYAPGDLQSSIYRWTSSEVISAAGPGVLTVGDADNLAAIGGPYGFAFAADGRLLFTTNQTRPASIQAFVGGTVSPFATAPSGYLTTIRCNPVTGQVSAIVGIGYSTVISTLTPVPEPTGFVGLLSLVWAALGFRRIRR